jgi:hypothetical protein
MEGIKFKSIMLEYDWPVIANQNTDLLNVHAHPAKEMCRNLQEEHELASN